MNGQDRVEIDDHDKLWRRLTAPHWIKDSDGIRRVSSAAFKGSKDDRELSTHAAKLTTMDWVFTTRPYAFGVGEFLAGQPRELGLEVKNDPDFDRDPPDYSHTSISLTSQKNLREKHAKKLANNALLTERPNSNV
jgi:hypothetical protein